MMWQSAHFTFHFNTIVTLSWTILLGTSGSLARTPSLYTQIVSSKIQLT